MTKQQQQEEVVDNVEEYESEDDISDYSSEDQNAFLLTDKVQEKLLTTVARLRNRDPTLYQINKPIFEDEDFEDGQQQNKTKETNKKFTYKDMLKQGIPNQDQEESQSQQLPPAQEQKKAKNKFKQALQKQKNKIQTENNDDDLFTVKSKLKKQSKPEQKPSSSYSQFLQKMKPQTQKLIKSVWQNPQKMDQTDVFLRDYIMNKKWLSKHLSGKEGNKDQIQKIDEEDEERSVQMDEYEAKYNFRYEEPDGDKIVQYPRKIQQSMRLKPESRKEKRKRVEQRKKDEQKQIRQQAEKKKQELRNNILDKLQNQEKNQKMDEQISQQFDHDWFFCDDCGKAFMQNQLNYQCQQCEDYMLCEDCNQLIIHKHPLVTCLVPEGFGAPNEDVCNKVVGKLLPCKTCRRKLPMTLKHYKHEDRTGNKQLLCDRCYDQSSLDVKKKFTIVEAQINKNNIEQILQKDPQKVKELTNSKQIQEMVDEYLKYEFQDVIGGGLKTKFRYLNVKPESYGLSDEQILFGDDKQLNKYISIKKLAPYRQKDMKLRNNIFKKKVVTINKSVKENKKLVTSQGVERKLKKTRMIEKLKQRSEVMKKKRQTKLKILNLSNPEKEKKVFVPESRLASYGVTLQTKQYNTQNQQNHQNHGKRNFSSHQKR